jgi:iron complex outermembrane receptor protein
VANAVKLACIAGSTTAIMLSNGVYAQEANNENELEAVELIQVTGSRLNTNPNLTSANPVLEISSEEIGARGIVNIEDLTNSLPQIIPGQTAEQSNGASGTAQLDLRGLGAVRTLSLIDGRRLPYGDSGSTAVNIDLVPTNLIERIEVLTGGSSAVYGSDAVSGVVNFILKDDFEGAEFDVQYGFAQSSNNRSSLEQVLVANEQPVPGSSIDGEEVSVSLTLGANLDDDKGNIVTFFSYQKRNEIVGADRVGSACTLGSGNTNGFGCVGSSNFRRFNNVADFGGTDYFQQEDGTFTPFAGGPAETFNFGASNFFLRPAERFQFYTKAHYEFAEGHELFTDIAYTQNVSDAQIAPSASFGFFARTMNCGSPLIQDPITEDGQSFAEAVLLCSPDQIAADIADPGSVVVDGITTTHRNVEGGPRNSRLENSTFRVVTGLRGTFDESIWSYETFAQYSESRDKDISTEDFQIDKLAQSLLVTADADGNAVCIDQSLGCVPYNIFQRGADGSTLVTQEALDFISGIGIVTGQTSQLVLGGNVQADLGDYGFASPLADGMGVGFLFGIEYREDSLQSTPDQISQRDDGGFTGVGGATLPVQGEVQVTEFYTEIQAPLIVDMPGISELVFNAQYRRSEYEVQGNNTANDFGTDTYGLQLTRKPVEDVTVRGQIQRSVRAPNVIELFTGKTTGLPELSSAGETPDGNDIFDPCSTSTPLATLDACSRTGVTAAQFGSIPDIVSAQAGGIFGGNTELTPETSDTVTFGVVYASSEIKGFSASIDYFDISIDDAIVAGIGAQNIIDNCLESGDPLFCGLVNRDAAGSLNSGNSLDDAIGFTLTNLNAASLGTTGFDFQVNYNLSLEDLGTFSAQYASTFVLSNEFTSFKGSETISREGKFVGQAGLPRAEYRHRFLLTWETPAEGLVANLTWRHFGEVENEGNPDSVIEGSLPATNYFDLSANYMVYEGVTMKAGVSNLFEENFPISVSSGPAINGNNNTFPGVYDTGRQFFFGLGVRF